MGYKFEIQIKFRLKYKRGQHQHKGNICDCDCEYTMARAKEFSLDLRKRIVNAHCKGEGYTKLSKRFQVSRTGVRGIIKKFKESSVTQNLSGRGREAKISKTLERKLVRDVSTVKTPEQLPSHWLMTMRSLDLRSQR